MRKPAPVDPQSRPPTQATTSSPSPAKAAPGKELVACALYRESPRAAAAFIKVNCAAVPENLIESEFFGHEKGSFTGATSKREGRFELAHGGTILLDEISEISPQVQAKLLRVLQERELERVGGNRTIKVDVRVIATTNRRLEESVERKEFRQDLYFRLNVVPIHVPPLREHKEDVPFLAHQFMPRFARKHGVRVHGISDACLTALEAHRWPGNVRELQNVIERAVILCGDTGLLEPEHLGFLPSPRWHKRHRKRLRPIRCFHVHAVHPVHPRRILSTPSSASSPPAQPTPPLEAESGNSLAEVEKHHILAALEKTRQNRTHAAKVLGISIRTLRNKLNEYGVKGKESESAADD